MQILPINYSFFTLYYPYHCNSIIPLLVILQEYNKTQTLVSTTKITFERLASDMITDTPHSRAQRDSQVAQNKTNRTYKGRFEAISLA